MFLPVDKDKFFKGCGTRILFFGSQELNENIQFIPKKNRDEPQFYPRQLCHLVSLCREDDEDENQVKRQEHTLTPLALPFSSDTMKVYAFSKDDASDAFLDYAALMDFDIESTPLTIGELIHRIIECYQETIYEDVRYTPGKPRMKFARKINTLQDLCEVFSLMATNMLEKLIELLKKTPNKLTYNYDLDHVEVVNKIVSDPDGNGYFKLFTVMQLCEVRILPCDSCVTNIIHDIMLLGGFHFGPKTIPIVLYEKNPPCEFPVKSLYNCILSMGYEVHENEAESCDQNVNIGFQKVDILEDVHG